MLVEARVRRVALDKSCRPNSLIATPPFYSQSKNKRTKKKILVQRRERARCQSELLGKLAEHYQKKKMDPTAKNESMEEKKSTTQENNTLQTMDPTVPVNQRAPDVVAVER